jgi:subtilisin family serine protease
LPVFRSVEKGYPTFGLQQGIWIDMHHPRRLLFVPAVVMFLTGVWTNPGTAGPLQILDREPYVPGEILLKLKPGASASGLSALGQSTRLSAGGPMKVILSGAMPVQDAVDQVLRQPGVEWAQPNYRFHALQCAGPTDPYVATDQDWVLRQIHAYGGWARFTGCPPGSGSVTVAVVDTGVDATHPDLAGHVLSGWNVLTGTALPTGVSGDDAGHGTFVAGLIGAAWNGAGMAGLAGDVWILPIKVLDDNGDGTSQSLTRGIQEAVARGARVINLSLGGYFLGSGDQAVLDEARAAGVVLVAAAGNDGSELSYPAAYPPLLAVGATDRDGEPAFYSNRGVNLDLMAPGGGAPPGFNSALEMFSTVWSGSSTSNYPRKNTIPVDSLYGSGSGTSFAAPLVSAAAALVWARFPLLTSIQVEDRLVSTTDDMGPAGWDKDTGYGLLNVERVLADPADHSRYYPFLGTFNSPNPFYPESDGTTNITLILDDPQPVEFALYDISGATVLKRSYAASELNPAEKRPQYKSYYLSWDGTNGRGKSVVTGVYFYEVKAGGTVGRNKIAVIRGRR